MKLLLRIFLLLLFVLGYNTSHAYYYKQYTTSNQLLSNNVYHSLLDSKGFMWFFTDKGVSKFDGQNFKNFTGFDGLSEHEAYFGYEDKKGRLWLYESNGNVCFIKNDTVYNPSNNKLLAAIPLIAPFIQQMRETPDSTLYIYYKFGNILKIQNGTCNGIIQTVDPFNVLQSVSLRHDTVILNKEVSDIYMVNDRIVKIKSKAENNSFSDKNYLLVSDNEGVKMYKDGILNFQLNDSRVGFKSVIHLYYDKGENIFCSTNDGLFIINIKNNGLHHLLNNIKVSCTSQDLYGNYWVSTIGNGIYCLDKHLDKMKMLNLEDNFKLYISKNGQVFFTKENIFYYPKGDSLATIVVKGLHNDKTPYKPIYISDKYLFYKNLTSTYFLNRRTNHSYQFKLNITHIYEVANDTFIAAGWISMYKITFNKDEAKFNKISLDSAHITRTCFDKEHRTFYYSHDTDKRLHCYNLKTNTVIDIDSFNKYQSIENLYLVSGNIALLTNDKHIHIYDIANNYKKTTIDKLPFVCYDIIRKQDNFLLNTNKGYYYSTSNGAEPDISKLIYSYKTLAYPFKSPDLTFLNVTNEQVICNLNGNYYLFDDTLLKTEHLKPTIFLDSIVVNGKLCSINERPSIHNHVHTNVSLKLSALKFNNLVSNFEYRIIHNDTSQWYTSTSGDLEVLFEKYGDYCIEMRAFTDNNLVSDSLYFVLKVFPPFYYSLPFYIIVSICITILIISAIRYYNRKKKQLFENELAYLQLEHKAINSLLNPHFIFNAINNIQNLVNVNSNNIANKYLAILSKLVRQNIENLQFNFIPIDKELSLIKNYIHLQNLRFDNKITLIINNSISDTDDIQIPPLLIHTFVENSVVHGFKKDIADFVIEIELSLSTDDYLIISIKDNGTGLSESKTESVISDKTSMGIDFMRKRLARISDFYKVSFSLEINDRKDIKGVEVLIVLSARFSNTVTRIPR